jgi:2-keto-4-pentenoate hydratase/2-oxohepta-3-ene-1,7-dioic acid hydratase in catechol pathway
MKYATFSVASSTQPVLGVLLGGRLVELGSIIGHEWSGQPPSSMLQLIDAGPDAWQRIADIVHRAAGPRQPAASYSLDEVRLYAPIPRPRKNVVCLGLNYVSHMEETARARGRPTKVPEVPVFFTKPPTSVNGPYDDISWETDVTGEVDYEVELGVVIGVAGRNIPRAHALRHVFGYTVINDVSARDLQLRHLQWFKGKSLDGFCPMGPLIVTADEFGDPQTKRISLRVNGAIKQDASTADMIFPVDAIVEWLSRGTTVEPGDVISTGTPEGVGLGKTPPEYLHDGDLIEAEVEGVGMLRNRLVAVRGRS